MEKFLPTNQLGNTQLIISQLGFGCAAIGNLYQATTDEDAYDAIHSSIKAGINYFDTAPLYGLGLSERRLGDVLRTYDRDKYLVSTKAGRLLTPDKSAHTNELRLGFNTPMPFKAHYDYTYDGIMRSFEDSLTRLGLAEIDILLIHDLGAQTHAEHDEYYFQQLASSGYKALRELRDNKLISAIGLGVNETEICMRAMTLGQFDCFLVAGRYTLLEQAALNDFLPQCSQHGASVIIGGPYNSGILATGVTNSSNPMYNYEKAPERIIKKVAHLEQVCKKFKVDLAAAALQFPLAHPSVSAVIPGLDSPQRVVDTLALFNQSIPFEFWQELRETGLVAADSPLPKADNNSNHSFTRVEHEQS